MDIIIGKIGDEQPLKIPEPKHSADKPAASESPRAEEDRWKTSESETSASVDNKQLRELVKRLQEYTDRMDINVAFSTYGEEDKKVAIIVSEKETGKIIREIPPEELQRLHVKVEELAGMLFGEMV